MRQYSDYQHEWELRWSLRVLIVALLAWAVLVIGRAEAQPRRLDLTPEIVAQLETWLNEPGGLLETAADAAWLSYATPAEKADTNLQIGLYQFALANNGRNVRVNQWNPAWLDKALEIVASYDGAVDFTYSAGGRSQSRSQVRTAFAGWLALADRIVEAPPAREPETVRIAQHGNTQYGIPDGNGAITGQFTQCAGDSDGDWYDELDEGFGAGRGTGSGPDTSTYWTSVDAPTGDSISTTLSDVTDPAVSTGHVLRGRVRKDKHPSQCTGDTGGQQVDATLVLLQTTTSIASAALADLQGWATITLSLTSGEADSITDYTALLSKVSCAKVGGGQSRACDVSAMELETPDASGAAAQPRPPWFGRPF